MDFFFNMRLLLGVRGELCLSIIYDFCDLACVFLCFAFKRLAFLVLVVMCLCCFCCWGCILGSYKSTIHTRPDEKKHVLSRVPIPALLTDPLLSDPLLKK